MDRLSEVEILAATLDEPSRALMRSAVEQHRAGRLDAAARITADQVQKRPRLKWAALLLALESAEALLAGAVRIQTPRSRHEACDDFFDGSTRWREFYFTTFPEQIAVPLELASDRKGYVLRATVAKGAAVYDPLVKDALKVLTHEIAAHLHATVALERAWASPPLATLCADGEVMSQKPSAGRIVHYNAEGVGVRPAVIIAPCLERFPGSGYTRDECQLHVFFDGTNDAVYPATEAPSPWRTSVPYDAAGAPGTWCWPPRV